jgi:hypothetical protein
MTQAGEALEEAGPACAAQVYLAAATEEMKLRPAPYVSGAPGYCKVEVQPRRPEDDPARMLLAVAGAGNAVLAVADALGEDQADRKLAREADILRGEIARSDAKCAVLTAITGAAAVFSLTQAHLPGMGGQAAVLAALLFAAATVLSLSALRPQDGTAPWRRWRTMTPGQVAADVFGAHGDGGTARVIAQLSGIATLKYRLVRHAIDLAGGGILALAVMLALATGLLS